MLRLFALPCWVSGLVLDVGNVVGLWIRKEVLTVALTVRTRVSEPLRHLELCGRAVHWVRLCGAALKSAAVAFVDCVNTDVSEFADLASVSWQCWVSDCLCTGKGDTTGGRGRDPEGNDGARKA